MDELNKMPPEATITSLSQWLSQQRHPKYFRKYQEVVNWEFRQKQLESNYPEVSGTTFWPPYNGPGSF